MTAVRGPLTARLNGRCAVLLGELSPGPAHDRVSAVREGLDDPLRLAVAGRLKAGKSTLVNALLGRRIAATDVGECTQLVTVFRYGFPERVVVRPHDGAPEARPLTVDGHLPKGLGVTPQDTASVTVELSNQALVDLVLVDTPGLASATEVASAATRRYLAIDPVAIDRASRDAVSGVETLIYVLSRSPRDDDRQALGAFRELSGQTGASAATCVAVLGRADEIGGGGPTSAMDPLAAATRLAEEHAETLRGLVNDVVPVAGLWAETARAGALTEAEAGALGVMAREAGRPDLLASARRFANMPSAVGLDQREHLLGLLGLRGVEIALAYIDAGCTGAAALAAELTRVSGIGRLRESLDGLRDRADTLKAQWGLTQLDKVPLSVPEAEKLRDAAEELRYEPAMERLNVLAASQLLATGVRLPGALADEVLRMATAAEPAPRLGLPAGASAEELQRAATAAAERWLAYAVDQPRTGPDQERVARLMYRSLAHLHMHVTGAYL